MASPCWEQQQPMPEGSHTLAGLDLHITKETVAHHQEESMAWQQGGVRGHSPSEFSLHGQKGGGSCPESV